MQAWTWPLIHCWATAEPWLAVPGFHLFLVRLRHALPLLVVPLLWVSDAGGQQTGEGRTAENAEAALRRAEALIHSGEFVDALERYTGIAQRFPQTEWSAAALWQVYLLQVRLDNAEGAFEALDRLATQQSGHFEQAQTLQLELVRRLMGDMKGERRSLEKVHPAEKVKSATVTAMLKRIIEIGPFSEAGIQSAFYLALALEAEGKNEEAASLHEGFIDRHPAHEMADDAAYQVAYIRYKRWKGMRGESPRYREAAAVALAYFMARYPESAKASQARSCLSDVKASEYRELKNLALYYSRLDKAEAAQVYYLEIGEKFPEIVQRDPDLREGVKAAVEAGSLRSPGVETAAFEDENIGEFGPAHQDELP